METDLEFLVWMILNTRPMLYLQDSVVAAEWTTDTADVADPAVKGIEMSVAVVVVVVIPAAAAVDMMKENAAAAAAAAATRCHFARYYYHFYYDHLCCSCLYRYWLTLMMNSQLWRLVYNISYVRLNLWMNDTLNDMILIRCFPIICGICTQINRENERHCYESTWLERRISWNGAIHTTKSYTSPPLTLVLPTTLHENEQAYYLLQN